MGALEAGLTIAFQRILKRRIWGRGLDSIGSQCASVAGPCKHNEPPGPMKSVDYLHEMGNHQHLKVISTDLAVLFYIESSVLLYLFSAYMKFTGSFLQYCYPFSSRTPKEASFMQVFPGFVSASGNTCPIYLPLKPQYK
jgi:hypothetical protein